MAEEVERTTVERVRKATDEGSPSADSFVRRQTPTNLYAPHRQHREHVSEQRSIQPPQLNPGSGGFCELAFKDEESPRIGEDKVRLGMANTRSILVIEPGSGVHARESDSLLLSFERTLDFPFIRLSALPSSVQPTLFVRTPVFPYDLRQWLNYRAYAAPFVCRRSRNLESAVRPL